MRTILVSLLHLLYGTVGTLISAVMARGLVLSLLSAFSGTRPDINFEVSSFAIAFVPIGLLAGYLSYARMGGKIAFWVFVIPCTVLLVRILTFPAPSIFVSGAATGWDYFFGHVVCSSPDVVFSGASRCFARMGYLGTAGSALSYSAGAFCNELRATEDKGKRFFQ